VIYFFDRKEKELLHRKTKKLKIFRLKKTYCKVEGITNEIPEEEALNIHKTLVAEWNEIGMCLLKKKIKYIRHGMRLLTS
jgi:hypothetical protein